MTEMIMQKAKEAVDKEMSIRRDLHKCSETLKKILVKATVEEKEIKERLDELKNLQKDLSELIYIRHELATGREWKPRIEENWYDQ